MKIDVSTIDGFEALTAEEKVAKLLEYDLEVPKQNDSEEVMKLKNALSKSNSECADWKRQYRETLSESERKEAERAENEKSIQEELARYRKNETVMTYKDQFRSYGYSDELAASTALAMADGDTAKVLANQKVFLDEQLKLINAAALNQQPKLSGGEPPKSEKIEDQVSSTIRSYAGL